MRWRVPRWISAHKADDERRERGRKEEGRVAQDADMEGGEMEEDDSAGEVGVSVEEGKRRKVVRKGRFCVGSVED